jgi:DNA-binding FrmR family transcriptional regulator
MIPCLHGQCKRLCAPSDILAYDTRVCYEASVTHTIREKQKLLARVRRIRGQVEAIERALGAEAGCEKVMHLISAARGAMSGLMAEVVEDHVRTHLVDSERRPGALNGEAADQLVDVLRTYLK